MTADLICPGCGTPVPNLQLFAYAEPSVFDGTLIWRDERCGHAWPRFPEGHPRHDAALKIIEQGLQS